MKLLILDFMRRWWWLFVCAILICITGSISGFPFVFAPAAVIALMFDAQRGVFRAVRPQPVTRLDQAKTWWFIGVPLLPLLSIPVLAIGVLIFQQTHSPVAMQTPPAPWFAAGVQTWVAFGYAGFCFFLMQWAPTRPAENLAENVQQGLFGALWGLSMPGISLLVPNLPRTPAAIAPWHWAVFVAAPAFVAVSYFSAGDVVQRRMFITASKPRPQADSQPFAATGGLTGMPLFVLNFAGRIVLMIAFIAIMQVVVMRWMLGGKLPANNPAIVIQVMMGLMLCVMTTESIGMRALRALPLSTARLALLLSLISWVANVTSAAFCVALCKLGDPALPMWLNFAVQSLALCGLATLALAATLHVASSGRLFFLVPFAMLLPACVSLFSTHAGLLAAIGAISGVAGFWLLMHGLRKSAAFYRPRGFFGMTPGQPSAVR